MVGIHDWVLLKDQTAVAISLGKLQPKYEALPVSEYGVAITCSPDPQGMPRSSRAQFKGTWPALKHALDNGGKYYCFPEFTLNGNIHYHIGMKAHNACTWQRCIEKLRRIGNTKVVYAKSPEGWYAYCSKEKVHMEALLKIALPLGVIGTVPPRADAAIQAATPAVPPRALTGVPLCDLVLKVPMVSVSPDDISASLERIYSPACPGRSNVAEWQLESTPPGKLISDPTVYRNEVFTQNC